MIKAIIIDDEQHCINRLQLLLKGLKAEKVIVESCCTSVEEGLEAVNKIRPDLLFLDVEINEKTGFDLLRQFSQIDFDVIFTTAFDKYAVQAFKFSAIDYLLKPIDSEDLALAIEKVSNKLYKMHAAQRFDALFHNLKNIESASKKICVPVVSGLVFLQVNTIVRCQSDINYTTIHTSDKQKLVVAKTLKDFEELLGEYNFYRIHNSHLINLAFIKSYHRSGFVTMNDQTELEVSTRRREDFLKRLADL
jgi:two-component system LytT family response regulator